MHRGMDMSHKKIANYINQNISNYIKRSFTDTNNTTKKVFEMY